jgi:hypothetical protein
MSDPPELDPKKAIHLLCPHCGVQCYVWRSLDGIKGNDAMMHAGPGCEGIARDPDSLFRHAIKADAPS